MCKPIAAALVGLITILGSSGVSAAPASIACARSADFNDCILAAVEKIHQTREHLGYEAAYFTKDLDYGPARGTIKASRLVPKTMCVAAVTEVLLESLNLYFGQTNDTKPFTDLPAARWNGWSALDIRDYMWENRGSHSAGYAFDKFGIGQKLDFQELKPGDFLSFDRMNGSGHSVIFLGYLDKNYNVLPSYSSRVAGFKYYSSQKSGVAGFAYRWAFFGGSDGQGVCNSPDTHPAMFRDCFGGGVNRRNVVGRGGRLWTPQRWHVQTSTEQLIASLKAVISPVIEQQFAQQIGDLTKVLSSDGLGKTLRDLGITSEMSSVMRLPDLKDKDRVDALARSPEEQRRFVQTPEVKQLIELAVQAEIEKPGPGTVSPKFLSPDQ